MVGAGIFPGDLLLVDRGMTARPGDVIIAALDGEFTVKRLVKQEGGFVLAAENPAYPSIALDDASEMSVWGVVTYVVHGLRAADRRR
jgi:DNA polymerase V